MNLLKNKSCLIALLATGVALSTASAQANEYRTLCKIGQIEIDFNLKGEKSKQYVRVSGLTAKPVAIGADQSDVFEASYLTGEVQSDVARVVAKNKGSSQSINLSVSQNGDEDDITLKLIAPEGDQKGTIGELHFSGAYYCI